MKINAYAKINLVLDVVKKRADGYHNVDMILQSVGLCDTIRAEKIFSGIELSGTGTLKYDKTNLAYKAAKLFFDVTGIRSGARIHIEKRIPFCAGMAGGSADAAAVLKALNLLHGKKLSKRVLSKISASLGADVPYCLNGCTARAQGIGEVITPIKPLPQKTIVIVKPPISVSTPDAYASLDFDNMHHPDTQAAVKAIESGNTEELYSLMGNSFENSIFKMHPEIEKIKTELSALGANAALMSGSGSAVFGIFEDSTLAQKAYDIFKERYKETFLTFTNE